MNKLFEINDYELLSKKVYHILKARIIKGDFSQGSKLFEAKIAKQLGVSRTPVREALRGLAAEGFVTMTPNQGMVVSKASIKDIQEVLQIRGVLEGLASRLAITLINKEDTKKLDSYIKQMEKYASRNDPLAFSSITAKFHELIANKCGNKQLMQIRKNLSEKISRYRVKSLSIPGRLRYSLEEHQEILEALKRKDVEQVEKLSQKHTESAFKSILFYEEKREDEIDNAENQS